MTVSLIFTATVIDSLHDQLVCVCVREKERETEKEKQTETQKNKQKNESDFSRKKAMALQHKRYS